LNKVHGKWITEPDLGVKSNWMEANKERRNGEKSEIEKDK
jgi:hypothetical protein